MGSTDCGHILAGPENPEFVLQIVKPLSKDVKKLELLISQVNLVESI